MKMKLWAGGDLHIGAFKPAREEEAVIFNGQLLNAW